MSRRATAPTMPHMISAFLSRRFPGRDRHLPGTRHGELSRRRVLADGRAGAEAARLDLHEVSNMHVLRQAGAGPQPRKRTDAATHADFGVVEMREGEHLGAGADADVFEHAVRSDADVIAKAHRSLEHAVDVD